MSDMEHPVGIHEMRLRALEEKQAQHEAELVAVNKRITDVEWQARGTNETLVRIEGVLKEYVAEMKKSFAELSKEILDIRLKPGRFVDGFLTAAISAAGGALVMWFLSGALK